MSENEILQQRDSKARTQREAQPELQQLEAPALESVLGNQTMQAMLTGQPARGGLGSFIQAKMKVNAPNDTYEQEADAMAYSVLNKIQTKPIQRSDDEELQMKPIQREPEEEELQMKPIQREPEEEELQMKPIQRTSGREGGFEVGGEVEQQIESSRGAGHKLDDQTRGTFEGAMGYDLSGVNIHTGDQSNQLNRSVEAKAFTTGSDIYFSEGQYNPASSDGQFLLGHELTHVVQQGHAQPIQQKEE